jgi:hypothetical protein
VFSIHSRAYINPDHRKISFIHFNESPLGVGLTLTEERPNFAGLKNSKFCNFENRPVENAGRPFSVPTTNFVATKSDSKPNLSDFRTSSENLKINILESNSSYRKTISVHMTNKFFAAKIGHLNTFAI